MRYVFKVFFIMMMHITRTLLERLPLNVAADSVTRKTYITVPTLVPGCHRPNTSLGLASSVPMGIELAHMNDYLIMPKGCATVSSDDDSAATDFNPSLCTLRQSKTFVVLSFVGRKTFLPVSKRAEKTTFDGKTSRNGKKPTPVSGKVEIAVLLASLSAAMGASYFQRRII